VITLAIRLAIWARSRGGELTYGVQLDDPARGRVTATVGPVTGYGRTAGEALEELAGELAEREGWCDGHTSATA
jgi:hypothetical protein